MQFVIKNEKASVTLGLEGAQLNSLKKNDIEYLWQGDAEFWAGQAPVCFPIVGVLVDGKAVAFGKECNMKRHGVARINPFKVTSQCSNSITFTQNSDDNTRAQFPFDYELSIKYTINGDTVTNEYIITNTGNEPLPFVIGGHPAFNCPLADGESFEDYKVIFDKPITKPCLRPDHHTGLVDISKSYNVMNGNDTLNLKHDLFEENDALIFESCEAKSVTLIGPKGRGIRVDFQDMNNILVWSAVGQPPFVALEPWTGISNCSDEDEIFENKRGMTILQPSETISYKFKITMLGE